MAEGRISPEESNEIDTDSVILTESLCIKEDCMVSFEVVARIGRGTTAAELNLVCHLSNIRHLSLDSQVELPPFSQAMKLHLLFEETVSFQNLFELSFFHGYLEAHEALGQLAAVILAKKARLEIHAIDRGNGTHLEFELVYRDFREKTWAPLHDFSNWIDLQK